MIEFLVFGLLTLTVICLWILIEGRKNPKFLIWFIPVILVLVSSTYITYTSILGFPKNGMPDEGVYIYHYVDEPDWIYLWIVEEHNIPKNYKIVYDKKTHNSLEGVQEESARGAFMVLKDMEKGIEGDQGEKGLGLGFTVGGDKQFYKWNYKTQMPSKD